MNLNPEQRCALNAMCAGENIFLTGYAGTGKSAVINAFIQQKPSNLVCLAPTGLAARNLAEAMTIHRCFNLPTGIAYPLERNNMSPSQADFLRTIKTVLIDEISMVRSDVFMAIEELLRHHAPAENQGKPFGGRQIIVVGDFYQLPPVVPAEKLEEYLDEQLDGIFAFNTSAWRAAGFRCIKLSHVHRQVDEFYINFLNEVRYLGPKLFSYLRYVNQQAVSDSQTEKGNDGIFLCCTRKVANNINIRALSELSDSGVLFKGRIQGCFPKDELPVAEKLLIKRGARVMIYGNCNSPGIALHAQYVNGDIGTVIDYNSAAFSVLVKLNRGPTVTVRPMTWSNYEYTTWRDENNELQIRQKEVGTFHQLPLAPAYATTIHKSQGQTLDKVHLVLDRGCFVQGQLYTALSRVRSLDCLTVDRAISPDDVLTDSMVQSFMEQL